MSQQGERPAAHEDDWWRRLYDESTPDTGASRTADSLDDRFDSASGTVAPGGGPAYETAPEVPEPREAPDPELGGTPEPWTGPEAGAEPAPESEPAPEPWTVPEPWRGSGPGTVPEAEAAPAPGAAPAQGAAAPEPEPWSASESGAVPVPETGPGPRTAPPAPRAVAPASVPPPLVTRTADGSPPESVRAPWEPQAGPVKPRTFPGPPPPEPEPEPEPPADPRVAGTAGRPLADRPAEAGARADDGPAGEALAPRPLVAHVGPRPPTYDAEPTALPATDPYELDSLVPDTVLDGARYGTYTLRAASVRGDSARFRGEPRRDALLTVRFGTGDNALVLVAVAGAARGAEGVRTAAADACRWIGEAVGRSHGRLSDDIRAGRRADLKSGLHRLTDRGYGRLRARAAELGLGPDAYTASLRCLLLSADPECRTRVFFGVGDGGLFRLRDGNWQDLEPAVPAPDRLAGDPVVGFGSPVPESGPDGDRLTMDLGIPTGPAPYVENPLPPAAEPFRFRASVARPGDTLLLCGTGLAEPMRGEPALAGELAARWSPVAAPGLGVFLADTQIRVTGYADDRTAVGVWEA